jgi:hypothetical protein
MVSFFYDNLPLPLKNKLRELYMFEKVMISEVDFHVLVFYAWFFFFVAMFLTTNVGRGFSA